MGCLFRLGDSVGLVRARPAGPRLVTVLPPNLVRVAGMDRGTFLNHVGRMATGFRMLTPDETEMREAHAVLAANNIELRWGEQAFPAKDFESAFLEWTMTNTPYLGWFMRALCALVQTGAVKTASSPQAKVSLDLKTADRYLQGERYASLLPGNQKAIAFWAFNNRMKL